MVKNDRNLIIPGTPVFKISKMLEKFYQKKELPKGFVNTLNEKRSELVK